MKYIRAFKSLLFLFLSFALVATPNLAARADLNGLVMNLTARSVSEGVSLKWEVWPFSWSLGDVVFTARAFMSSSSPEAIETCVSTTDSCLFSNLDPNVDYFFTVDALTATGEFDDKRPRVQLSTKTPDLVELHSTGKGTSWAAMAVCLNDLENRSMTLPMALPGTVVQDWEVRDLAGSLIDSYSKSTLGEPYQWRNYGSCKYGNAGSFQSSVLQPGTTYEFKVRIQVPLQSGLVDQTISQFITTAGGCPLGAPLEPMPWPDTAAVVSPENIVLAVHVAGPTIISDGFFERVWASKYPIGTRYVFSYTNWPGKNYAGQGYIYDPISDNFARPLNPDFSPTTDYSQPVADPLVDVGLGGCKGVANVSLSVANSSSDNCTLTKGVPVPKGEGFCEVEVLVTSKTSGGRAAAAKSTSRKAFYAVLPIRIASPSSLIAKLNSNGTFALSWKPPTKNGADPVTDYIVEYSADAGATWRPVLTDLISTSTKLTTDNLPAGKSYTFRVISKNAKTQSIPATSKPIVKTGKLACSKPMIVGVAKVGNILQVQFPECDQTLDGTAIQWLVNGKAVRGETGVNFRLLTSHKGGKVTVRVTATKAYYITCEVTSTPTSPVLK